MPDPTKIQAIQQVRSAIDTALWVGISKDEINAIIKVHFLDRKGKRESSNGS